jgi:hypothetical protein
VGVRGQGESRNYGQGGEAASDDGVSFVVELGAVSLNGDKPTGQPRAAE